MTEWAAKQPKKYYEVNKEWCYLTKKVKKQSGMKQREKVQSPTLLEKILGGVKKKIKENIMADGHWQSLPKYE